jgi:putative acetyltransferase
MKEPVIRSYLEEDQPPVETFFASTWAGTRFPFDPLGAHSDLRRIAEVYQSDRGDFWLLVAAESVVGTVAIRSLSPRLAEVKRLNVLASFRNRGHGRRLLLHALRHAADAGFDRVRLDTLRLPGPAVRLFAACGFEEIPRYNDNPDAELFMELSIGQHMSIGSPAPRAEQAR